MRTKSQWVLLFVGVALLCLVGWGSSRAQSSARGRWEYKVIMSYTPSSNNDAELNKLGAEGWELVTIREVEQVRTPPRVDFYLKRAR